MYQGNGKYLQLLKCEHAFLFYFFINFNMDFGLLVGQNKQFKDVTLGSGAFTD